MVSEEMSESKGNGAREALEKVFDVLCEDADESFSVDTFLLLLANAGYVVKPIVEH